MPELRMVVDVWVAPVTAPMTVDWPAVLDATERTRAAALPADAADRFVRARVLLRHALAPLLACAPADVALRAQCPRCGGQHGQVVATPPPATGADAAGPGPVHVSVTRAGPVTAVAVSRDGPVGIDAECLRDVAAAPLADVALSPRELSGHRARRDPGAARLARTWVRKEASLKAAGTGLEVDPSSIEVLVPPAGWRGVDALVGAPFGGPVAVADLRLGRGRAGAVALQAPVLLGAGGQPGALRRGPRRRLVVRRYDGASILRGRRT